MRDLTSEPMDCWTCDVEHEEWERRPIGGPIMLEGSDGKPKQIELWFCLRCGEARHPAQDNLLVRALRRRAEKEDDSDL